MITGAGAPMGFAGAVCFRSLTSQRDKMRFLEFILPHALLAAAPSGWQDAAMPDHLYEKVPFRHSEIEHRYGPNVHILSNPYLLSQLALLCAKETHQPAINRLVVDIYARLLEDVMNAEFPRRVTDVPTRMFDVTPAGVFHGEVLDRSVRAVTVNIARAGAIPSQTVFDLLNVALDPRGVRQDHIIMSRMLG